MARVLGRVVLVLLVIAAAGAIYLYQRVGSLESRRLTDDVHVLFGLGGNVGVLGTERGAVVVDTMSFRMQGDAIRERVEQLTGRETEVILNTHYHWDHTHGNPAFPSGLRIVSTGRTLELLRALDGEYFSGAAAGTLPSETFDDQLEFRLGGKTVRAIHPGRGHTDGDLVVLFVEDRVIHMGDLLFDHRYPNIDLEAGGSVRAWVDTLDRVLALSDQYDQVIPGHGDVTDRAGIVQFQAFLRELWEKTSAAAAAGQSLEETLVSVELEQDEGYEAMYIPGVVDIDRDFVVRRAWEEATGAVTRRVDGGDAGAAAGHAAGH